ncbi:conserved hypothetical protein [delta proteobacterium NaphS2]|nr:conserved hypothetical protein [delta proteobacterium NaphS2]
MKDDVVPIAKPSILLREEFDDWAVLFSTDSGEAYGINPVSVFIWKRLDGERTIDGLVEELIANCDDAPDDAGGQVLTFVNELLAKGFAGYEVDGR